MTKGRVGLSQAMTVRGTQSSGGSLAGFSIHALGDPAELATPGGGTIFSVQWGELDTPDDYDTDGYTTDNGDGTLSINTISAGHAGSYLAVLAGRYESSAALLVTSGYVLGGLIGYGGSDWGRMEEQRTWQNVTSPGGNLDWTRSNVIRLNEADHIRFFVANYLNASNIVVNNTTRLSLMKIG